MPVALAGLLRLLRSAALARGVLIYLAVLCGVAAWLPWVRAREVSPAPGWAVAVGLDQPFSSAWLLGGVALLFASTLACTWGKRGRVAAIARGELPGGAVTLGARRAATPHPGPLPAERGEGEAGRGEALAFLRAHGFRGDGLILRKGALALWGGLVLHWGLLAVIGGVVVQQAFHDGGSFPLAVGEQRRLSEPGAVFGRERGLLAPEAPPDLTVALADFDPFRRQPGYAPDRHSVVELSGAGGARRTAELDRAEGVELEGTTIYQAIPTGLAVVIETAARGRSVVHLESRGPRTAVAEVSGPSGPVRLVVDLERGIMDPLGTGALSVRVEEAGRARPVAPGEPFALGTDTARIVGWTRWAGFSYARSPGMPAVLAGFGLVLMGALLLALPTGVARLPGPGEEGARVWVGRGSEALLAAWREAAREEART
jgi:hypothetical protein